MALTFLDHDKVPDIPLDVAKCPICGAQIVLEIDAWEQLDDGTWAAAEDGTHVSCTMEPDIDDDGWEDWFNGHYSMPYVDWMPVDTRVYKWLLTNYRFREIEQ
jgi:hypothetical protein